MSFLGRENPHGPDRLLPCVQRILDDGLGKPSEHKFRLHTLALGCRRAGYTKQEATSLAGKLVMRLAEELHAPQEQRQEAIREVFAIVEQHYAPDARVGFNCSLKGLHRAD